MFKHPPDLDWITFGSYNKTLMNCSIFLVKTSSWTWTAQHLLYYLYHHWYYKREKFPKPLLFLTFQSVPSLRWQSFPLTILILTSFDITRTCQWQWWFKENSQIEMSSPLHSGAPHTSLEKTNWYRQQMINWLFPMALKEMIFRRGLKQDRY